MKIFVGCSSSNNLDEKFYQTTLEIAKTLTEENNELIFGASYNGLMKIIYNEFKTKSKKITGIVSKTYEDDLLNLECDKTIIKENSCERCLELIKNSELIIFLPGGIGTLSEILMAIDMKRNNELKSDIIIFNPNNYFDDIINMINKSIDLNFSNTKDKNSFSVTTTLKEFNTVYQTKYKSKHHL